MIDIDEIHSIERDSQQWILRIKTGTNTEEDSRNFGQPIYKFTYHASLKQIANVILSNVDVNTVKNLTQLIALYETLQEQLTEILHNFTNTEYNPTP